MHRLGITQLRLQALFLFREKSQHFLGQIRAQRGAYVLFGRRLLPKKLPSEAN
jgi:hypothetical protein